MSAELYRRHSDLLRIAEIQDREIQAAAVPLMIASVRCLTGKADNLEDNPVDWTEAHPAFAGFLLPLAKRLQGLRGENQEKCDKIKKDALKWVELVIENTFSDVLQSSPVERDCAQLIDIACLLCNRLNRLPTKKEVKI